MPTETTSYTSKQSVKDDSYTVGTDWTSSCGCNSTGKICDYHRGRHSAIKDYIGDIEKEVRNLRWVFGLYLATVIILTLLLYINK